MRPDPLVLVAAACARSLTAPRYRRFCVALANPAAAQARALGAVCAGLARSTYGRRYGVRANMDYCSFATALPIVAYDALARDVAAAEAGTPDLFWPGPVRHWEATSGSSGVKKCVPITPTLRQVFSHAFYVWAHDLLANVLQLRAGKLFMALAPPSQKSLTHEASFVAGPLGWLLRTYLVAPMHLARPMKPEEFRRSLATALLKVENLEVVSLWNPSYFLALMDLIGAEPETFARAAGLSARRDKALRAGAWHEVWPALQLISAWDSATAAAPASRLRRAFPNTFVQGKGLLTTETPVTIPLIGAPSPVPLIDRVVIELKHEDGLVCPLSEAKQGETYRLIVSTPGGFARYDLGDLVRVGEGIDATPGLEFIGRGDAVSDLVGEKLHETVAFDALTLALGEEFALLLPRLNADGPARYLLLSDCANEQAASRVERALLQGHHYARARALGQLAPVAFHCVPRLRERYFEALAEQGQRLDSIKDRSLIPDISRAQTLAAALTTDAPRLPL